MHVVAATNVPAGRFDEVEADSYDGAWFVARHLSKQEAGVSFGVYEVRSDGAHLLASFLNGERRFTAAT
jgi:hypothetical protein